MKTGTEGKNLIKFFEGCRLEAYLCPAGRWTIGYGHTEGVRQGQRITREQAEAYLETDLERFERAVMKYHPKYRWTQNEFDALVSFAYNLGAGNLDKLTASGTRSRKQIQEKIPAYYKAGGIVLSGLVKRRAAEQKLFAGEAAPALEAEKGVMEYSLKKDGSRKLSQNFKVSEFKCKDGSDKIYIDQELVEILQKLRNHFGRPVVIQSAYRSEAYNSRVGGAKKSMHLYGKAADIKIGEISPAETARIADQFLAGGIGIYDTFTHIDTRAERYRFDKRRKS